MPDNEPFPMHFNGNGLLAAQPDEAVEETYVRLILESPYFTEMPEYEQETFMLGIAQECIQWVQKRKDY